VLGDEAGEGEPGGVQVRRADERAGRHHPRVVHQEGDIRALRRDLGGALRVGDFEGNGRHAGLGDGGWIARGSVDPGRTALDQFPGIRLAEPAVGSGDHGSRSVDLHDVPPLGRDGLPLPASPG